MYNFYSFVHTRATVGWLCVQFDFLLFSELLLCFVVVAVAVVSFWFSFCCCSCCHSQQQQLLVLRQRRQRFSHSIFCSQSQAPHATPYIHMYIRYLCIYTCRLVFTVVLCHFAECCVEILYAHVHIQTLMRALLHT